MNLIFYKIPWLLNLWPSHCLVDLASEAPLVGQKTVDQHWNEEKTDVKFP